MKPLQAVLTDSLFLPAEDVSSCHPAELLQDRIQKRGTHMLETPNGQSSTIPSPCRCTLSLHKLISHPSKMHCCYHFMQTASASNKNLFSNTHCNGLMLPFQDSIQTLTLGKICKPYVECLQ